VDHTGEASEVLSPGKELQVQHIVDAFEQNVKV
jgi:hypothetical protein